MVITSCSRVGCAMPKSELVACTAIPPRRTLITPGAIHRVLQRGRIAGHLSSQMRGLPEYQGDSACHDDGASQRKASPLRLNKSRLLEWGVLL